MRDLRVSNNASFVVGRRAAVVGFHPMENRQTVVQREAYECNDTDTSNPRPPEQQRQASTSRAQVHPDTGP